MNVNKIQELIAGYKRQQEDYRQRAAECMENLQGSDVAKYWTRENLRNAELFAHRADVLSDVLRYLTDLHKLVSEGASYRNTCESLFRALASLEHNGDGSPDYSNAMHTILYLTEKE